MKDFDMDNTIENVGGEKKAALLTQLHNRTGIPQHEEPQIKERRRFFNIKTAAFGVVGIIAVSIAIVLPISLRKSAPAPHSQQRYTYNAADFDQGDLGLTVREYAEQIGKNILYLDWYDNADEYVTTKYFLPNEEDKIIYISEDIYNGETGDHVRFSFVDNNIDVDYLEEFKESCKLNYEYNNMIISWGCESTIVSRAYFEYNDYKYYVQLFEPMSDQAVLDIVKEMF